MSVETWRPGMFERACGGCTMCCKAPGIPEIGKAPDVWCRHCAIGRGCRIYDERPAACRAFQCLWKVMPDFPEELRPDRCKVFWTMTADGRAAIASTEYPNALQTPAHRRLIGQFENVGVQVVINSRAGGGPLVIRNRQGWTDGLHAVRS